MFHASKVGETVLSLTNWYTGNYVALALLLVLNI